jgi:hypothetical protein
MRLATIALMLFALPGSVAAQVEFLTAKEIFQAINYQAAHPASPANFTSVSPFAPDFTETRMPEIFADLAKSILRCYHPTSRYELAEVTQTPWDPGSKEDVDGSALIRIRYFSADSESSHEIKVGLVSREDRIRTTAISDSSPTRWDTGCPLEKWTTLEP